MAVAATHGNLPAKSGGQSGFSLIEVLIALTILALAAGALIGAGQAHVDRIGRLETRTAARWVAQNQLVEMRLGLRQVANQFVEQKLLDRSWRVEVRSQSTNDPDLVRVEIAVSESSSDISSAELTGFVDTGAANLTASAAGDTSLAAVR